MSLTITKYFILSGFPHHINTHSRTLSASQHHFATCIVFSERCASQKHLSACSYHLNKKDLQITLIYYNLLCFKTMVLWNFYLLWKTMLPWKKLLHYGQNYGTIPENYGTSIYEGKFCLYFLIFCYLTWISFGL